MTQPRRVAQSGRRRLRRTKKKSEAPPSTDLHFDLEFLFGFFADLWVLETLARAEGFLPDGCLTLPMTATAPGPGTTVDSSPVDHLIRRSRPTTSVTTPSRGAWPTLVDSIRTRSPTSGIGHLREIPGVGVRASFRESQSTRGCRRRSRRPGAGGLRSLSRAGTRNGCTRLPGYFHIVGNLHVSSCTTSPVRTTVVLKRQPYVGVTGSALHPLRSSERRNQAAT